MARNETLTITKKTMTEITNEDATSITFQVQKGRASIVPSTSSTAPSDTDGALRYHQGQGEANVPLDDLFPGFGAVRLLRISSVSSTERTARPLASRTFFRKRDLDHLRQMVGRWIRRPTH